MDLRGRRRRRRGASVSSIKWDEHGAGLFWGSRGRSRHGGDPRPRAQPRSDRQSDCARFASILGASRSRCGRSTACSRARARCSGGCGARREGPRGRSSHLALRRAGRGARREADGKRHLPIPRARIQLEIRRAGGRSAQFFLFLKLPVCPRQSAPLLCQCAVGEACILTILILVFLV